MSDTASFDVRQTLPLPYDDRGVGRVVLGEALVSALPAEQHAWCQEIRRILRPGGTVELAAASVLAPALWQTRFREAGFDPMPRAAAAGDDALRFIKPNRSVSGDPLVSLVIPAYSPRFFEACLSSAMAQSYEALEILICDDSPGTEIEEIAWRWRRKRPLSYVRNGERLNTLRNYARCFELARGEFVKFLNDDDLLMPDCVAGMIEGFRRVPDLALATSYRSCIDEKDARLLDLPATRPIVREDAIVYGPSLANVMVMAGLNVIGEPSTVMFRKADLTRVMPQRFAFENRSNIGMVDMAMWRALLLQGDALYFSQAMSRFRLHPGQGQKDPKYAGFAAPNIRAMQADWLAGGLHQHFRRDAVLAKPYAGPASAWRVQPLSAMPAVGTPRFWRSC